MEYDIRRIGLLVVCVILYRRFRQWQGEIRCVGFCWYGQPDCLASGDKDGQRGCVMRVWGGGGTISRGITVLLDIGAVGGPKACRGA